MARSPFRFLAILLLVTSGCTRPATKAQGRAAEAYVPDSGSVCFDIGSVKREESGSLSIQATYRSGGKLAKFGIEFGPTRSIQDSKDFPMTAGEGRFVAEPGSDAAVLLANLRKALEARALPPKVRRVEALPFTFVNLGNNLSQASAGAFKVDPRGDWTAMKIFIGQGEQEGEVFVNFNPTTGKGQFSIKDAEYGDLLLEQLATVL